MDEGMSGFCIKARGGGGTKCGRWNPTGEQVKVLTDLFRSGLRTPSTDQIQRISSQLSYYGKIESKNVFYWFQNHKARERQKRRRVSVEDRCLIDRSPDDNNKQFFPTLKHLAEMNHQHNISESDQYQREIETLQLFPLNSYEESIAVHNQPEKMKFMRNHEYKETTTTTFSCMFTKEIENHHLPLDLRLSFM